MQLVVFDIDGTLIRSERSDGLHFVRAFDVAYGIRGVDTDWLSYGHCTDAHVTRVILERAFGRAAGDDEIRRCRDVFADLLRAGHAADATLLTEVPGARAALGALQDGGTHVAIGTGGWRTTALFKLTVVGLDATLPGAFADDDPTREGIVRTAVARAEERAGRSAERVVYVGDAVWDVRTCRALGVPFVGIATDGRAARLRAEGAHVVLEDYADLDAVHDALDAARPPG